MRTLYHAIRTLIHRASCQLIRVCGCTLTLAVFVIAVLASLFTLLGFRVLMYLLPRF